MLFRRIVTIKCNTSIYKFAASTGHSEYQELFTRRDFQDLKRDILLGIQENENKMSNKSTIQLKETKEKEIFRERYRRYPKMCKVSMEERKNRNPEERLVFILAEFKEIESGRKLRQKLIEYASKPDYGE